MLNRRLMLTAALVSLSGCGNGGAEQTDTAERQGVPPPPPPAPSPPNPTPAPPPPATPPPPPTAPPTAPPPPPQVFTRGSLPAWVPLVQGEASLVPMQNTLQDVAYVDEALLGNQSTYVFAAYSGGVYNPHYGAWGAHVIHGGGHAATQDNSVFIADFNTLRFERIGGPTLLTKSDDYEQAIKLGGFADDFTNPREVAPGVPGSAHTYDCLLLLPPSICGDPYGALIRPVSSAVGAGVSRSSSWSHMFTLGDRRWQRFSTNRAQGWAVGGTCAYDSRRNRIWPIASDNLTHLMVLDASSRTWSNTPTSPQSVVGYPDMVYSAYCEHRDIVVMCTNASGEKTARFYWFAAASSGQARTPVTFASGALPSASWGQGSLIYVRDTAKLVWFSLEGGDFYYELDVPADPGSPWSWVARPISGPARPSLLSPAPYNSIYKRMDYSPQLKSLIWVTAQSTRESFQFGGRVVAIRIAA